MSHSPVLVSSGAAGKGLNVVGEVVRVLADASQTGSYEVFDQEGPEGAGPPPHTHPWDEAYYMLDGEMDVLLGERTQLVKPGDFVHIPAGVVHCFHYRTRTGRFLSVTSRAGASKFFREVAAALPDGALDLPKIIEIAARNEVRYAGPPGPPPG